MPIVFIVSTETSAGRAEILKFRSITTGFSVFLLAFAFGSLFIRFEGPEQPLLRYGCATSYLIFALFFVFAPFPRGRWRVDNVGIHWTSRSGRMTSIVWDEVQAVKWNRYRPSFKTKASKTVMPLSILDESERNAILAFVETHLDEFDLPRRRKTIEKTGRRWLYLAIIAGISLCAGAAALSLQIAWIEPLLEWSKWPKFRPINFFTAGAFTVIFLTQLIEGRLPKWRRRGVKYPTFLKSD